MIKKHPDSYIIDSLGGTAVVARLFNIAQPSVTKWRATGIPSARRMYLRLARPDLFHAEEEGRASHMPKSSIAAAAEVTGQAAYGNESSHA